MIPPFLDERPDTLERIGIKKDDPEGISPLGVVKPGDVLLSHNL